MDHVLSPFDQLKAFVSRLVKSKPRPTIDFTPEQRQTLLEADMPVPARDPETKKEYIILQREVFDKLTRVLEIDEIDPSLFEFEEIGTVVESPRAL
jgi:hypothetical protein